MPIKTPTLKNKRFILFAVVVFILLYYIITNYSPYLWEQLEYHINYSFMLRNITLGPSDHKNVLLFSNSTIGGCSHLMYALPILKKFFAPFNITELLLIPYAHPDIRDGVNTQSITKVLPEVHKVFNDLGIRVKLLDPTLSASKQQELIRNAQSIYFTGGNTFNLIKNIHDNDLLSIIKEKINQGTPFIGVSAGTVIHGPTMKTTNDMPIVFPKSFESLNTVPFQINVHYNNTITPGFHGETRDDRLKEYLQFNRTLPNNSAVPNFVMGLKEGTAIHISGTNAELVGFGTRPAVQLSLDKNDQLIKTEISVGKRIDNLINL